jgi:hypothetical protein
MDALQGVSNIQSPMAEAMGNTSEPAWRHALAEASFQPIAMSATAAVPKPDPWGVAGGVVGGVIGAIIGGGAGGLGGGAGGTLVAPGVGTVGGAVVGGEEGVVVGGAVGGAVGYAVGTALHGVVHWMENAGQSGGSSQASKPDPKAVKPFRDDPGQLEGKSPAEVEKELDQKLVKEGHWTKSTTRDGNGIRYIDGKGDSVIINKGYPGGLQGGGGDPVHEGPYVKIQPGNIRVPLAGNPALGH